MAVKTHYSEVASRRSRDAQPLGALSRRFPYRLARHLNLPNLLRSLVCQVDPSARRIRNTGQVLLGIDLLAIGLQDDIADHQVISQQRAALTERVDSDSAPYRKPACTIGDVEQAGPDDCHCQ